MKITRVMSVGFIVMLMLGSSAITQTQAQSIPDLSGATIASLGSNPGNLVSFSDFAYFNFTISTSYYYEFYLSTNSSESFAEMAVYNVDFNQIGESNTINDTHDRFQLTGYQNGKVIIEIFGDFFTAEFNQTIGFDLFITQHEVIDEGITQVQFSSQMNIKSHFWSLVISDGGYNQSLVPIYDEGNSGYLSIDITSDNLIFDPSLNSTTDESSLYSSFSFHAPYDHLGTDELLMLIMPETVFYNNGSTGDRIDFIRSYDFFWANFAQIETESNELVIDYSTSFITNNGTHTNRSDVDLLFQYDIRTGFMTSASMYFFNLISGSGSISNTFYSIQLTLETSLKSDIEYTEYSSQFNEDDQYIWEVSHSEDFATNNTDIIPGFTDLPSHGETVSLQILQDNPSLNISADASFDELFSITHGTNPIDLAAIFYFILPIQLEERNGSTYSSEEAFDNILHRSEIFEDEIHGGDYYSVVYTSDTVRQSYGTTTDGIQIDISRTYNLTTGILLDFTILSINTTDSSVIDGYTWELIFPYTYGEGPDIPTPTPSSTPANPSSSESDGGFLTVSFFPIIAIVILPLLYKRKRNY